MPYCCVPGCGNKSSDLSQQQEQLNQKKDISYHRLPLNNQELLKIWCNNLNIPELSLSKNYRVCSEHFDTSCFRLQSIQTNNNTSTITKRLLINGSIPFKQQQLTFYNSYNSENYEPNTMNNNLTTNNPYNCCIIGCKYNLKRNRSQIQLFSFPNDTNVCLKWIEFVNKNSNKPIVPTKYLRLCQMHFTQDDFQGKQLKQNAIPSIFESIEQSDESDSNYAVLNPLSNNQLYYQPPLPTQQQIQVQQQASSNCGESDVSSETSSEREDDTSDSSGESSSEEDIDLESVTPVKQEPVNKQIEESPSSRAKRLGLTDVINKLHRQHSNSMLNTSPTAQLVQQAQNLSPPPKIPSKPPINKSEMDLYKLLERANLTQYFNSFTEQGGDDLNQLLEASDEEFKEIMDLVGMSTKPLHIKRLKKVIDEYKAILNSDSFTEQSNNKNLHSPTTSSSAASGSSGYASLNKPLLNINESRTTESPTNFPMIINHDNDNSISTPMDYSKLKRRSPSTHSSVASESGSDEVNESLLITGENTSFSSNKNEQNEKNIKKSKVIDLYNQGERCVRKLSQLTGVPLTTVYRVIGKLKGINYNIPRGNGAGRKTILDAQDREVLVEILKQDPKISRKALGKELEKRTGKSVHNSTLNRELCRLRHYGQQTPQATPSTPIQQTSTTNNDLPKQTANILPKKEQQIKEKSTNKTNSVPSYPAQLPITPSLSQVPSQNQQHILPTQAMLAAAAMMSYPNHQSLPFPHQFPTAALAAYQSYFSHSGVDFSPNLYQATQNQLQTQIDDQLMQKITIEARKYAENLPKLECKPVGTLPHDVATQLMELQTISPDNEMGKRDVIRRVVAALTRFDTKKTFYEQCLHEVLVQLCILKPNLLTRRDDLINFGGQVVRNLGIQENQKRPSSTNEQSANKRAKVDSQSQVQQHANQEFVQPPNPFNFYFNHQYPSAPLSNIQATMNSNSKLFWPFGAERGEVTQQQHIKKESTSDENEDYDDNDEENDNESTSDENENEVTSKFDSNNNKHKKNLYA